MDVVRIFGKDPLGLGGRLPELPELEERASQHRSAARQIGVEFEGAARGRGRLPWPVHPVVDASGREVGLGVAGLQFDQPPELPEGSLQLPCLPVGLAPAQKALRVHGQQVDLGAARVPLVEQRRQVPRLLGKTPRPVAVACPVPGARQHGDDGLGIGTQLVGAFEIADGLIDIAAREGKPAEAEVRDGVVGFEARRFPVVLVRVGGEADLLERRSDPDAGRRVVGVEFDGLAVERRRRGRIARLFHVRPQVDPAEVAGRQPRGFGIRGRGLLVELVGVERHGEAAPGGRRVGLAGCGGEFLLDGGSDPGFDGGEIGGRELGGLGDGGNENQDCNGDAAANAGQMTRAPGDGAVQTVNFPTALVHSTLRTDAHRPSPRARTTSLPLAVPANSSTAPPGQVTSKRSTLVASPRPMWSGASPPVR